MFGEKLNNDFEKHARKRNSLLFEGTSFDGYVLGFKDCKKKRIIECLKNDLDEKQFNSVEQLILKTIKINN